MRLGPGRSPPKASALPARPDMVNLPAQPDVVNLPARPNATAPWRWPEEPSIRHGSRNASYPPRPDPVRAGGRRHGAAGVDHSGPPTHAAAGRDLAVADHC